MAEETKGKAPAINMNSMAALGIEVIDVRIKQINLPMEVSKPFINVCRAEREAVARRHRSQGQEEAVKIRAAADKTVTETLAESGVNRYVFEVKRMRKQPKPFADAFSQDLTSMRLSVAYVLMRIALIKTVMTSWC